MFELCIQCRRYARDIMMNHLKEADLNSIFTLFYAFCLEKINSLLLTYFPTVRQLWQFHGSILPSY
jgi:hypothetical protein